MTRLRLDVLPSYHADRECPGVCAIAISWPDDESPNRGVIVWSTGVGPGATATASLAKALLLVREHRHSDVTASIHIALDGPGIPADALDRDDPDDAYATEIARDVKDLLEALGGRCDVVRDIDPERRAILEMATIDPRYNLGHVNPLRGPSGFYLPGSCAVPDAWANYRSETGAEGNASGFMPQLRAYAEERRAA